MYLTGKDIQQILRKNGTIILTKSLKDVKKDIGSIIEAWLLTLLVLTICSCSGAKLMLVPQITESQIGFSLYSGKHVKPTSDVMVCATSKTDALVFHSWRHQSSCIKQQYLPTHALGYYQNQGLTLKKCLPTKLYPYQSTIRSFSNPYKMVWTDQRRSLPTGYQRQNSQGVNSTKAKRQRNSTVSTRRSTGRTRVTTRMTVRNSNFSPTTNQVSGSVRIIF